MKKNIGSQLALYPMPLTVIGAMNGDVPTWTLVAHAGILGHDRVLVSLAEPHYINEIIKQGRKLSINIEYSRKVMILSSRCTRTL